jgi:hypothetical protein
MVIWFGVCAVSGNNRRITDFLYMGLYLVGIVLAYMAIYYNGGLKGLTFVCILTIISVVIDTLWLAYLVVGLRNNNDVAWIPIIAPNPNHDVVRVQVPSPFYEIDITKVNYYSYDAASPDSETCVVCLEPYRTEDPVMRLYCGHLYHRECVSPWLNTNGACPTCRSDASTL